MKRNFAFGIFSICAHKIRHVFLLTGEQLISEMLTRQVFYGNDSQQEAEKNGGQLSYRGGSFRRIVTVFLSIYLNS